MKVWAFLDSAETLHVRPAVTVLASCAAGVRRTMTAREADVIGRVCGESHIVDAAQRSQRSGPRFPKS